MKNDVSLMARNVYTLLFESQQKGQQIWQTQQANEERSEF